MALENIVKEALNALYHHPDDAVRSQADHWLQNFQRTLDAWQVSDNLLHDASSNVETQIFCSQTLRSKVQRDFEELPSEAFRPLRDSLNNLLKTFHKGTPKVRTQISLAVAALAVQVPAEDWGDGGIMKWLRDEMNSYPDIIPSFLELLRVLPEVSDNLLHDATSNVETQIFCSQTLRSKVITCILTNGQTSKRRELLSEENSLVNWASSRLHDNESLDEMVEPAIRKTIPAKALSRFADIVSLCTQPLCHTSIFRHQRCYSTIGFAAMFARL